MSIRRSYSIKIAPMDVHVICDSIGAHVAHKLGGFGSDERTLTDELADMMFLWAALPLGSTGPQTIGLDLHKVTQHREATIGADLEILLRSPQGFKRSLFQAKVVDPDAKKLRARQGQTRLRQQLVKAQSEVGELAFALVYIPADDLDGRASYFQTWEQRLRLGGQSATPARRGATAIRASQIIDTSGAFRQRPGVQYRGAGRLTPTGISLSRVLLEMISCSRGRWESLDSSMGFEERPVGRILLAADFAMETPDLWRDWQYGVTELLDEHFE